MNDINSILANTNNKIILINKSFDEIIAFFNAAKKREDIIIKISSMQS